MTLGVSASTVHRYFQNMEREERRRRRGGGEDRGQQSRGGPVQTPEAQTPKSLVSLLKSSSPPISPETKAEAPEEPLKGRTERAKDIEEDLLLRAIRGWGWERKKGKRRERKGAGGEGQGPHDRGDEDARRRGLAD